MQISLRTLRAQADDLRRTPLCPTLREQAQREDILDRGTGLLARNGCRKLGFSVLAQALQMSPATLRRHFADIDALIGEILTAHLRRIVQALAAIPADAPDRTHHLCAAYLNATRLAFGRLTDTHLIFTRDRCALPEDVLEPIEAMRQTLAMHIAGDELMGHQILDQLDMPMTSRDAIGPLLAYIRALAQPVEQVAPLPLALAPAISHHRFGPDMPPEIAAQLEAGDTDWLRPAGLRQNRPNTS